MISQFLVYIEGSVSFLFPHPYLSGGLAPFGEEKKQQMEVEHILHLFPYPYFYTYSSFVPFIIIHIHVSVFK